MIDTPTSYNQEDFRQRYRNTYGFLKREGKPGLLIYIKESSSQQVVFTDSAGNEFYANLDQNVVFEFLPIIRGWYNTELGPRYFTRIPEKQYHRGISRGNTAIYYPIVRGDGLSTSALHIKILEDVFVNKPASSFIKYQTRVCQYFVPNKYFLLTDEFLFMYDRVIGTVNDARNKITLSEKIFEQEVLDFIRRGKLNMEVVSGG